jgi:hypothetical protein
LHNCADFARSVIDFYYPRTLHRNVVADLGITTPKQLARTLVKFSRRHADLESSSFVIPQVPGSLARSTPVYGGLESILKSKKYLLPLVALHPIVTAGLAAAYFGTGRFDPAKQALVLDSKNRLQAPLAPSQRRTREDQLNAFLARSNIGPGRIAPNVPFLSDLVKDKIWSRLQAEGKPSLDSFGHPVLQVQVGEELVDVGLSRDNILTSAPPPGLAREILAYRLRDELSRSAAPRIAESDVENDWNLLRQVTPVHGTN